MHVKHNPPQKTKKKKGNNAPLLMLIPRNPCPFSSTFIPSLRITYPQLLLQHSSPPKRPRKPRLNRCTKTQQGQFILRGRLVESDLAGATSTTKVVPDIGQDRERGDQHCSRGGTVIVSLVTGCWELARPFCGSLPVLKEREGGVGDESGYAGLRVDRRSRVLEIRAIRLSGVG